MAKLDIKVPGRDIGLKTRKRPGLWCRTFKLWCMVRGSPQGAADNEYICRDCIKRGGPAKQTAHRHGEMNVDLRRLGITMWKRPRKPAYQRRVRGRRVA
jgi:hypothetical protein